MYLTHLSLTNFRNFARLDVEAPRGPVLMVGDNAQGKTSILEAIYFLATFVSFHASNERQLINLWTSHEPLSVARIVATFCRLEGPGSQGQQKTHRLEVRIVAEETANNGGSRLRKEILLDGVKRRMHEAIGAFNAVLFLPQMLRIIEGSPDDRRRYINLAMAQALPHYATSLSDYNQILTQRNALLKQLNERGSDLTSAGVQLTYWDERLARAGAEIMYARIQMIRELERLAARLHRELTHGQEVLRISYQPSFEPLPARPGQFVMPLETSIDRSNLALEKIQHAFLEALRRSRVEEIARGVTTLGPHRDEVRFLANQMDLGVYGSRGQARTAVLALKLAEVAWMKDRTGEWPVLLLDEVLAELDPVRRADLLSRLLETEQAMMTTTDLDLFTEEFIRMVPIWRIHGGHIQSGREDLEV
jgi:DNA replication and repair protein RecF